MLLYCLQCTIEQVLLYNGQLDVIVGAPLTERFLLVLNWDGAGAYRQADRHVWKIKSTDTEVAGFVRQVNDFTQVRSTTVATVSDKYMFVQ